MNSKSPTIKYQTKLGTLYQGDCLDLMKTLKEDSVDLIFTDPPFNLSKLYPSKINDNLKEEEYLDWCKEWINGCIRILKKGGSFFLWNLPKWNLELASFINSKLTFRHAISVDIKYSLPIKGRLYPSHYSLLYYCKGKKPNSFNPDRLPMKICKKCHSDLVDYGGYKDKMNPKGVNMSDVWYDIPPVRHSKYKGRKNGNELSVKLLDRVIEMSSKKGDVVFDPFGGAGTTYIVAEIKQRKWIGIEIGPIKDIINRFKIIDRQNEYLTKIREEYNHLFSSKSKQARMLKGLWTDETIRKKKKEEQKHRQEVLKLS